MSLDLLDLNLKFFELGCSEFVIVDTGNGGTRVDRVRGFIGWIDRNGDGRFTKLEREGFESEE